MWVAAFSDQEFFSSYLANRACAHPTPRNKAGNIALQSLHLKLLKTVPHSSIQKSTPVLIETVKSNSGLKWLRVPNRQGRLKLGAKQYLHLTERRKTQNDKMACPGEDQEINPHLQKYSLASLR